MFLLDGFEKGAAVLEASVGWVAAFGFVTHARAVGAACVGCKVVGAGGVPVAIVALVLVEVR